MKLKVEGLKELDRALGELPKATGKNVVRRVLRKSLEPILTAAKANAPVATGRLRESMVISSQLKRSQRGRRETRTGVTMYVGSGATGKVRHAPHAHLVEFGTAHRSPKPYMRPAFDANKEKVVEIQRQELGTEIAKAWDRLVKKAAKRAAR
jgi:HK97 gp10 family phage protein